MAFVRSGSFTGPARLDLRTCTGRAQAVRPWGERLTVPTRGHVVDLEAVNHWRIAVDRVMPQRRADLGDDGVLVDVVELELATRRWQVRVRRLMHTAIDRPSHGAVAREPEPDGIRRHRR